MTTVISGIKCDNCDFHDDSVQFEEYPNYLGKPCPTCGHNLLTEEDYSNAKKIIKIVKRAYRIFNVLKWFNPFHYWRLIFGDNRPMKTVTYEFPHRKPKT